MPSKLSPLLCILFLGGTMPLNANTIANAELPIKKVSLFSSGVGYFEHQGKLENSVKLTLPFQQSAMDDILKSLIIYDTAANSPFVSYPSEDTLKKTLESIKINLSGNPSIEQILVSLKGENIEIYAPNLIKGKIIGTQTKPLTKDGVSAQESFLSLFIEGKIQLVPMSEIVSYGFTNPKIAADFNKALELTLNSRNNNIKDLSVYLPSNKKRDVSLSYVMASPVWKASYRLDLSTEKPILQGWAIVDNAGDTDWKDVELSLVVGRPVSFIQPLYAPYYVNRPILPLSIAGFAMAQTYDGGYDIEERREMNDMAMSEMAVTEEKASALSYNKYVPQQMPVSGKAALNTNYQSANAKASGEQFAFTIKNPITLERRQSAMIPLIQTHIEAKKVSIFSAQNAIYKNALNPSLGVELKNNSDMKLPAGPISVYDGGSYAGDALIEFFAQNDKRLVSYGDDLSVEGIISSSVKSYVDVVKINRGILNITRKNIYSKEYLFKNSGGESKNIILEHPFMSNAKLIEPSKYSEKTANLYRFNFSVSAGKELRYAVKEELPHSESISILNCDYSQLTAYSQNSEMPQNVKEAFKKAMTLASGVKEQETKLFNAQKELAAKENEQERVRKNMAAVDRDSIQYKDYLKKLTSLDQDMEKIYIKINSINADLLKDKKAYSDYIANLSI